MAASTCNDKPRKNVFITGEETIHWRQSPGVVQYHCEFVSGVYEDSLYDSLAVDFPTSLTRAVAKRKAEFLAGRFCARQALISLGMEAVAVGVGPRGNPLWPTGITGSISHCRTRAAAVISADTSIQGLGIDIEHLVDEDTLVRIRDRVLVPEELPLIGGKTLGRSMAFTLIFATKESFYKAANPIVSEYFGFDAVTVTGIDTEAKTVSFRLNYGLHPRLPRGTCLRARFAVVKADTVATLLWV